MCTTGTMPCARCGTCTSFVAPSAKKGMRCRACGCPKSAHTSATQSDSDDDSGVSSGLTATPRVAPAASVVTPSSLRRISSPASVAALALEEATALETESALCTPRGEVSHCSEPVTWPVKPTHSSFQVVDLQVELLDIRLAPVPRSMMKDRSTLRRLTSFGGKNVDIASLRGRFQMRFRVCGPLVTSDKRPRWVICVAIRFATMGVTVGAVGVSLRLVFALLLVFVCCVGVGWWCVARRGGWDQETFVTPGRPRHGPIRGARRWGDGSNSVEWEPRRWGIDSSFCVVVGGSQCSGADGEELSRSLDCVRRAVV